jgi:hypothetical protein
MKNNATGWTAEIIGLLVGCAASVLLVLSAAENGGGRIPIIVLIGLPVLGLIAGSKLSPRK